MRKIAECPVARTKDPAGIHRNMRRPRPSWQATSFGGHAKRTIDVGARCDLVVGDDERPGVAIHGYRIVVVGSRIQRSPPSAGSCRSATSGSERPCKALASTLGQHAFSWAE
jgi:hypothetical protein